MIQVMYENLLVSRFLENPIFSFGDHPVHRPNRKFLRSRVVNIESMIYNLFFYRIYKNYRLTMYLLFVYYNPDPRICQPLFLNFPSFCSKVHKSTEYSEIFWQ